LHHGYGADVPFQPGGDSGGEVLHVRGGEQEAGVVAAEAGEEVGRRLEECGVGVCGLRYGGEGLAGCRRRLPGSVVRCRTAVPVAGLVAGDRAGDDPAAGDAGTFAAEVTVGLQLAQSGGDADRALGEAGGEGLDVDADARRERLEVYGQADRQERQLLVLGEVVADHREAFGVAGVLVDESARVGVVFARDAGLGAWGRARVFRVHQEVFAFLGGAIRKFVPSSVVRPSHGIALPAGAVACLRWVVVMLR
jgi:hypothetical protein